MVGGVAVGSTVGSVAVGSIIGDVAVGKIVGVACMVGGGNMPVLAITITLRTCDHGPLELLVNPRTRQ
jgi:hypothetical protein